MSDASDIVTAADNAKARANILREFLTTTAGRHKVAAAMIEPLRLRLDYMGLTKLFPEAPRLTADEIEPGAISFETTLKSSIDYNRPTGMPKYDSAMYWLEKLQDRIRTSFQTHMADAIITWLDTVGGKPTMGPFDPWPRGKLLTNAKGYAAMLKHPAFIDFEPERMREILRTGLMGEWRDMQILVSRSVLARQVYRLGPTGEVAAVRYDLALEYDEEKSSETEFAVKASLSGRLIPVDEPLVKVFAFPEP